jgi:hypothetical protein
MQPDGSSVQRVPPGGAAPGPATLGTHQTPMDLTRQRAELGQTEGAAGGAGHDYALLVGHGL